MMKKYAILLAGLLVFSSNSQAMTLDWSGGYRFEYVDIDGVTLGSPKGHKTYMLNHLHLSPKIVAADGVNIVSRFEVFPNTQYPDSQVGQAMGSSTRSGNAGSTQDSNVASERRQGSTVQVSQLYINANTEYGSLLAGRTPIQFGLGITHNAGLGPFDHWYDSHDLVGYKFIVGNFFFMPMYGKVYDSSPALGQDITDMMWHLEYNNPETQSQIGLFMQNRTTVVDANDAPVNNLGGSTKVGGWNTRDVNIFFGRGFDSFDFKLEAGFKSGGTGVFNTRGEEVSFNGYGIATELNFSKPEDSWQWALKAGVVSGDNPDTTNFEGYHFDRNYDVAFLLFNHPMGAYDIFKTRLQRNTRTCTTTPCAGTPYDNEASLDEEAMSNIIYVSPRVVHRMNDKLDWSNSITWAQLQTNPRGAAASVSNDIGFEWDTGLVYKPVEKIQWVNEVGFFFPGTAWDGGANYSKTFTYGFSSKAAISF